MTFIASVIAKKGVAVIADSLVTSIRPVIELEDFKEYIKTKQSVPSTNIQLDINELTNLFHDMPSYTKDYEEKLFKYDKYTAITTSGAAIINSKRIGDLINEIVKKNNTNKRSYAAKSLKTKVEDFQKQIAEEVKLYLGHNDKIDPTNFIISHFDKVSSKTTVFKVNVIAAQKSDLQIPGFEFVTCNEASAYEHVVCDGQNGIASNILYGRYFLTDNIISDCLSKFAKDHKISYLPTYENDFKKAINPFDFLTEIKILRLRDLSLQQAVDLANLLMKIEMDFQKYTENMPTVGGVIKIAIINADGFKFIAGHEIINPVSLH